VRLTLVGPLPPPTGGIASHVADLAVLARAQGLPTQVLVPAHDAGFAARLTAACAIDLVHVHVHGHSVQAWLLASACGVARRAVLTVHSGLAPAFVGAHPLLARAACLGFDAIVCVSEPVRSALAAAGVPVARLWRAPAFLRDALAPRLPPPGLAALRRRHPILAAAAVAPGTEYGVDVLLSGWELVHAAQPRAALMLYGPGSRDLRWRRAGVYQWGELDRAAALGLVEACDVLLRPTRADGDAVSVREALALGRRVVASDAAPRPRGVVQHRSGDARDLAAATLAALAQPAPRVLVEQARAVVLAIYRAQGALGRPPATYQEEAACAGSPAV
jgi:glycosyltransferase involved in cell wall biosynthesis